jgi:hypothetical protein
LRHIFFEHQAIFRKSGDPNWSNNVSEPFEGTIYPGASQSRPPDNVLHGRRPESAQVRLHQAQCSLFLGECVQVDIAEILLEDGERRLLLDFGFPYKRHKLFYEEYLKPRSGAG